jgi:hypothetical protein
MKDVKQRLAIVGSQEDVPRKLTAFMRACDGEVGYVAQPTIGSALVIYVVTTKEKGKKVRTCYQWGSGSGGDCPQRPTIGLEFQEAIELLGQNRKDFPRDAGPVTLRGSWSGYLYCEGGQPVVRLQRRLAPYGILQVTGAAGKWSWAFQRGTKWFSRERQDEHGGFLTLRDAILAGYQGAQGSVGEACSYRDTHRRSGVDPEYAIRYPTPAEKVPKDRVQQWEERVRGLDAPASSPTRDRQGAAAAASAAPPAAPAPAPASPAAPAPVPAGAGAHAIVIDPQTAQVMLDLFAQSARNVIRASRGGATESQPAPGGFDTVLILGFGQTRQTVTALNPPAEIHGSWEGNPAQVLAKLATDLHRPDLAGAEYEADGTTLWVRPAEHNTRRRG